MNIAAVYGVAETAAATEAAVGVQVNVDDAEMTAVDDLVASMGQVDVMA
jgi:hypothetical protein